MHVDVEYHHSLVSNSLEVTREELFENAGIPLVENANSWPDSTFNDALGGSPLKNDCFPNKRSKGHPDPIQRKLSMLHQAADAGKLYQMHKIRQTEFNTLPCPSPLRQVILPPFQNTPQHIQFARLPMTTFSSAISTSTFTVISARNLGYQSRGGRRSDLCH